MLLPLTPHLLLWDKESFVKKKKYQYSGLRPELERVFYVPKIKERLMGYIPDTFSRFSSFSFSSVSVLHKWRQTMLVGPTWSKCPCCTPAVSEGYLCMRADRTGCQQQATCKHRSASEHSSCKVWISCAPASSPCFLSALIYLPLPNQRPAISYLS